MNSSENPVCLCHESYLITILHCISLQFPLPCNPAIITTLFADCRKKCYFVDLFVRISNTVAVDMYHHLGYIVYRKVLEYYSGDVDEDAFGKTRLPQFEIN